LRKYLNRQGYRAVPWGLGRNTPDEGMTGMEEAMAFRREMEETLANLIADEVNSSGGKVSLVGWSLGGLYATGLAHRYPELVRQVITLGTPFGDPRGTALYSVLQRIYKGKVTQDTMQEWTGFTFAGELKVPVTALYSLTDGIVGSDIALLPEHPHMENIAVMASHVGFPFNPLVRAVVAERLAQPEQQWQPYTAPSMRPFVYQPA
jgi:pimeloyl-ACP methyl ester carboxylesterase